MCEALCTEAESMQIPTQNTKSSSYWSGAQSNSEADPTDELANPILTDSHLIFFLFYSTLFFSFLFFASKKKNADYKAKLFSCSATERLKIQIEN